jgi:hypothetical protein
MTSVRILRHSTGIVLIQLQTIGTLTVHWTTHEPRGLSKKDLDMARYCDEQAKSIGTVEPSQAQQCGPR